MTKRGIIRCILSILLMAYLVVAMCFSYSEAKSDSYRDFRIAINNDGGAELVTADQIDQELGHLRSSIHRMPKDSVNTLAIERRIMAFDNVENVNCVALNNGVLQLDVVPLIPVARVFDLDNNQSYYINRSGKRMQTSRDYRIDAPVILGRFSAKSDPSSAIPVIDYIGSNPPWNQLVSAIEMNRKGDILLVPMIQGHVVNFGDTTDIANKFDRLKVFYKKVMPVKGWNYYDTISVKWRGQIVAKRHTVAAKAENLEYLDEDYIDDESTMSTEPTPEP